MKGSEAFTLLLWSVVLSFLLLMLVTEHGVIAKDSDVEAVESAHATQIARLDDRLDAIEPTRTPRPTAVSP